MPDKRIVAAHGQPCPYCTRTMVIGDPKLQPSRDHIKPRSRFGPKDRYSGRYIIVCSECNFIKGNLTLEEFIYWLIAKNRQTIEHLEANVERMRQIRYLISIGLE